MGVKMKAMTLAEAKAYYTPIIQAEVNRCNTMIECIKETIAEIGEDDDIIQLLNEITNERDTWASGLE
jgi:hypothetical protein